MKCSKCNKEISDESKFCQYCGATVNNDNQSDTQTEKEDVKKTTIVLNKKVIISAGVIISAILIIFTLCLNKDLFNTNEDTSKVVQTSANIQTNGVNKVSFNSMNADDEKLNEIQKEIINYFDNDYIFADTYDIQMYPQVFKNAKIYTAGGIVKILKSEDDEFEVLVFNDISGNGQSSGYDNLVRID